MTANLPLIVSIAFFVALPAALSVYLRRLKIDDSGDLDILFTPLPHAASRLLGVGSFLWLIAFWTVISESGMVDRKFLPPPHEVAATLYEMIVSLRILDDVGMSLLRIAVGFFMAALLGTLLGLVAGSFRVPYAVIIPPNSFMRYIPPTVFISVFVLWFGIGEAPKIFLIFAGTFFFIVQMVSDAALKVDRAYKEIALTLGANHRDLFWRVILPAALPDILRAWRINLSAAWIFLVVAEFVSANKGLGHIISTGQRFLNTHDVFATILLIGLLGILIDLCFEILIRSAVPWNSGNR